MKQRTLLITGGSRGIGKSIVKMLKRDYKILSPSRDELNLLDDTSIESYLKSIRNRRIDILINNAGINIPEWIDEVTDENIYQTVQTNLVAPIKLIRGLVPGMKARSWGRIVNISSAFGIVARGKQTLYVATKHGLNGTTKALAIELARYNILVNSVCPGFANTDMVVKRNSREKLDALKKTIPLGRLLDVNEIAEVVRFLISEKNSYMTGTNIVIDGGFTIQ